MSRITVYTKPACPQCNATVRTLNSVAGITYDVIDITQDSLARDYVMSLGYLFSSWFCGVSSLGMSLAATHGAGATSRAYLRSFR